jgi:hypothetical protein
MKKQTANNLHANPKIEQTIQHYFTPHEKEQISVAEYHAFMRKFVGSKYSKTNSILHMTKAGYKQILKRHKGTYQFVYLLKIEYKP